MDDDKRNKRATGRRPARPPSSTQRRRISRPRRNVQSSARGLVRQWLDEAATMWDQQNYQGAIACWREALQQDSVLPEAWSGIGMAQGALGDHDGAVASLQRAVQLAPENPVHRFHLGNEEEARGALAAAIQAFRSAVEQDGEFYEAWNNLGNCLAASGELEEAERWRWSLAITTSGTTWRSRSRPRVI